MRKILAGILVLLAGGAGAAQVTRDITVRGTPAALWQTIGGYCQIADWHPVVAACVEATEGGARLRRLTTKDGAVLVERLVEESAAQTHYSYVIIGGPLPVQDYTARISVTDAGGGRSRILWTANFAPRGVPEAEAVGVIGGIFDAGLGALRQRFGE